MNTILLKDKYVGEYEPLSDSEVLYYLTNQIYVLVIIFFTDAIKKLCKNFRLALKLEAGMMIRPYVSLIHFLLN